MSQILDAGLVTSATEAKRGSQKADRRQIRKHLPIHHVHLGNRTKWEINS
jgi:hypothetical protein